MLCRLLIFQSFPAGDTMLKKNQEEELSQKQTNGSPKGKTDHELWMNFISGNESAIADIYAKYVPVLYNYGMNIISNSSLVNDTIQDVFFELINKRTNLSPATSVKFYLIASFRRRLLRQITRERKLVSELNEEQKGFLYKIEPDVVHISSNLSLDKKKIIQKACNNLPKRQREAIALFFFEGLSYQEIAQVFDFSHPKNARTLIYRALDSLSKILAGWKTDLLILSLVFAI